MVDHRKLQPAARVRPTERIVVFRGVAARVWEGSTEDGLPFQMFVASIRCAPHIGPQLNKALGLTELTDDKIDALVAKAVVVSREPYHATGMTVLDAEIVTHDVEPNAAVDRIRRGLERWKAHGFDAPDATPGEVAAEVARLEEIHGSGYFDDGAPDANDPHGGRNG